MIPLWAALLMIPTTWAVAAALVPWASRHGDWTLPFILAVGCSGSIVAVCLA